MGEGDNKLGTEMTCRGRWVVGSLLRKVRGVTQKEEWVATTLEKGAREDVTEVTFELRPEGSERCLGKEHSRQGTNTEVLRLREPLRSW